MEVSGGVQIVVMIWVIVTLVSLWGIFEKAGEPGWACIVPFYNSWVWCKVAGMPGWVFIGFFIPYVGAVFSIVVTVLTGKCFGKGVGFILGLIFLPFIFLPILAFGNSEYCG